MLIERDREKLLHALVFFSKNVRHAGKTKLFKLLNFLDFLHFQKTGRSVTGQQYYAWKMGPVPKALNNEWDEPTPEFNQHFVKGSTTFPGGRTRQTLTPRVEFNEDLFSPFELSLMQALAKRHFNDTAQDVSELSHFETGPWHEVWEVQGDRQAEIPYELVLLRRGAKEDMELLEIAKEYEAIRENYKRHQ